MKQKQAIILAALGAFVVVLVVAGIVLRSGGDEAFPEGSNNTTQEGDEEFTSDVPKDAQLDEPETEVPAAAGTDETLGIFNMQVSKNGYKPPTLTVKKGNLVQINLTAIGGDFDFSMPYKGLYQLIKEGETKQISFGVKTSGTYDFMCRDYCPGDKVIEGQLIVLP